jgi:hypothetical protein
MNYDELCWIAMSFIFSPNASITYQKKISRSLPQRYQICREVAKEAQKQKVNPILAISVAYHETRFSNITSNKGAKGPLGVIPKYHCQEQPCNYTKAGVHALKKYLKRNDNLCDSLAQYNYNLDATCAEQNPATLYANKVINTYYELKHYNQEDCYDKPIK